MGTGKSGYYCGINIKDLKLIGEGNQGKVFKLTECRVLKVFKARHSFKDQLLILQNASCSRFFPRIYAYDDYSIIMEFINGQPLDKYLASNKISKRTSFELVELINEFIKLGFTRLDIRLPHIFVQKDESVRIIDPRKSFQMIQPYPKLMLRGLQEKGALNDFFNFISIQYSNKYLYWNEQWKLEK